MRQIVLDTETTGLEPAQGHRIIEIGCVEILDRRITGNRFHQYLQPDRDIDEGAIEVHGITAEFLRDKPRFGAIVDEFLAFLGDGELIIHNAPFDLAFLRHEVTLLGMPADRFGGGCAVIDTLTMARNLHPGQKNSLDALCRRYDIDNSQRTLHGALLDAEILADVYLAMTGGQSNLLLERDGGAPGQIAAVRRLPAARPRLPVLRADEEERAAHRARLDAIERQSGGPSLWTRLGLD
ncbi:MAG: DNA polymerase III subunit epsilon [Gammaproteobacteria bacterium]|jgi:DNA polymerase-3 subunit epsilon|nr:DNA polymerase III subunit epsilon [Gammaproteobacteria bacterium]